MLSNRFLFFCCSLTLAAIGDRSTYAEELRLGMIGLDTSHVIAFTDAINDPNAKGELAGMQVVAGFPGGTDIPPSRDRVEIFTNQLRARGIKIVDSIPELLEDVDAILLESVDGRPHLEQARIVIQAGVPLFIDKPAAGSLADVIAIFDLAKQHQVPCFSSSSLRYGPDLIVYRAGDNAAQVQGCATWGPCSIQPPMPDLFFYGVHGIEMLYTVMGTGCESVARTSTEGTDFVTGRWTDGRVGTYRGIRQGKADFGAVVYQTNKIDVVKSSAGYQPLLQQIGRFFRTGEPPVSAEETIEIFAFMEAADLSKHQGGKPVRIEDVISQARETLRQRP